MTKQKRKRMNFWDENDIFRLMNNSVYDETTNKQKILDLIMPKDMRYIKMNFWDEEEEAKVLFQKLLFYNTFIEKPRIKRLKHMNYICYMNFHFMMN